KGKVELQAQNDAMELTALKDIQIASVDGKLVLSSTKEVWIGAGGSYIRITASGIENVTLGEIYERCAYWDKVAPAAQQISSVVPHSLPRTPLMLRTVSSPISRSHLPSGMPFKLLADGVKIQEGIMDNIGQMALEHRVGTKKYELELANLLTFRIPVPEQYSDDRNGELANHGIHYHEPQLNSGEESEDRSKNRQVYSRLVRLGNQGQGRNQESP
ncbi:DUF2345 domain-containing protein, partial [Herbaspirillum lusitanum]